MPASHWLWNIECAIVVSIRNRPLRCLIRWLYFSSGFVATELVKQLLEKGYNVSGSVRTVNSSRVDTLKCLSAALPGHLELVEADILVPGAFDKAVQGCTYIFHTA